MGYPRPPVVAADHAAALEGLRAATTPEAFASAWEEGSELALDTAIASATRGRGPRGRPATGWESLTDTELEVARLVGRGYTNSQIAADLFVAVSTIKTHLVHIYVKLDISSRVALSTLAVSRLKQPTDPRP
jgi:DNA-binding CsgD family transcriptional regulator